LTRLRAEAQAKEKSEAEVAGRCIELKPPGLVNYTANLWPTFDRFDYFQPYAEVLETAIGGALRYWFAAPPQHGKSEFTLRAFLYWARFSPGYSHAYVTYNQVRAREIALLFQTLAVEAGFVVKGTLGTVELEGDTTIKFTSIQGSLTGSPITGVCIIDDPVKDAEEARSPKIRRRFENWWLSVARSRRHKGTSFIGMGTRWNVDDPGGYLCAKQKFQYVNLKAIATPKSLADVDAEGRVVSDPLHRFPGESLWSQKPPEYFEEERTSIYWWSAMFQGEPVPMGANVFAEPGTVGTDDTGKEIVRGARFYRSIPEKYDVGAFGLDLAYTCKTAADWSICIEGVRVGQDLYVVDVVRKQVEATNFALTLKAKSSKRPGWKMRWYASGTEKGSAQFIRQLLRKNGADPFRVMTAKHDKFVRSIGVAARWNSGHVLLPDPEVYDTPWLSEVLEIITRFTGVDDEHDDDVDALAALHDQLFHASRMTEALTG
jgi:predicted phage terminase large subunit-like protein